MHGVLRVILRTRRKARKSFEHDPTLDPNGAGIPDINYQHLGKRVTGHIEPLPSSVQRLQDRAGVDLLGLWRQDPTPTHPFGIDNVKTSARRPREDKVIIVFSEGMEACVSFFAPFKSP